MDVHLNGGAYPVGAPHQDEHLVRGIAGEVDATVVNVDYSTGPKARYPQAHEECTTSWSGCSAPAPPWAGTAQGSRSAAPAPAATRLGALELAGRASDPALRAAVLIVPGPPARSWVHAWSGSAG